MSRQHHRKGRGVDKTGRSKGDGAHARVYPYEADSMAFRALKPGPRAVLLEIKLLFNGANNGELFLSQRDVALKCACSINTAAGWLWALEATGFVRPRIVGAFSVKERHATTWILDEFMFAGAPPTRRFTRWRPGDRLTDRAVPKGAEASATGSIDDAAALAWAAHLKRKKTAAQEGGQPEKFRTRTQWLRQAASMAEADGAPHSAVCLNGRDRFAPPSTPIGLNQRDTDTSHGRGAAAAQGGPPQEAYTPIGGFEIRSAADVTLALRAGIAWMGLAQQAIALDIAAAKRGSEPQRKVA